MARGPASELLAGARASGDCGIGLAGFMPPLMSATSGRGSGHEICERFGRRDGVPGHWPLIGRGQISQVESVV